MNQGILRYALCSLIFFVSLLTRSVEFLLILRLYYSTNFQSEFFLRYFFRINLSASFISFLCSLCLLYYLKVFFFSLLQTFLRLYYAVVNLQDIASAIFRPFGHIYPFSRVWWEQVDSNHRQNCLCRVSRPFPSSLRTLVGTSGLEPPTSRLSGVCSNQLSYVPE